MRLLVWSSLCCFLATSAVAAEPPAKELFGRVGDAAPLAARSIGSYARGCLAGGVALPTDGPEWQAMRLSRNRNWGHPAMVAYVKRLAKDAREKDGWPGLLVGDLAQPRGGPMLTGHRSHQIGLDADIWLRAMPDRVLTRKEREEMSAISVLKDRHGVDPKIWTDTHVKLLRRAASYKEVARIFVHPAIKTALCKAAGDDRGWLRKIRPWYGHHYHFHVRLNCPAGVAGCKNQPAPPAGDGCGKGLEWWMSEEPWRRVKGPKKKRKPLSMASLPAACRGVLKAGRIVEPAPSAKQPPVAKRPPPVAKPKS